MNIFERLRTASRRRATASKLHMLDDHLLADIGITRGEIDRLFERPVMPVGRF